MSYDIDPWHVVHIKATYYCPEEDCKGHAEPQEDPEDAELYIEVEHPEDCGPPEYVENLFGLTQIKRDPNEPWECPTERDMKEWWNCELPSEVGSYRVECWWAGPDYEGEYDAGCNWEKIEP